MITPNTPVNLLPLLEFIFFILYWIMFFWWLNRGKRIRKYEAQIDCLLDLCECLCIRLEKSDDPNADQFKQMKFDIRESISQGFGIRVIHQTNPSSVTHDFICTEPYPDDTKPQVEE